MELAFLNTPILFFNSGSRQKFHFTCDSAIFQIETEGIKSIILLKENKTDSNASDLLFIPSNLIYTLRLAELKTAEKSLDLDEQLMNLKKGTLINCGFIVSLKYLDQTFLGYKSELFAKSSRCKAIANEIFKARRVDLSIMYLDDYLEIMKQFPSYYSQIRYLLQSNSKGPLWRTSVKMIDASDSIDLKIKSIEINNKLPQNGFMMIWNLLSSRRTRFSLSNTVNR